VEVSAPCRVRHATGHTFRPDEMIEEHPGPCGIQSRPCSCERPMVVADDDLGRRCYLCCRKVDPRLVITSGR